jgi:hypothetical protein
MKQENLNHCVAASELFYSLCPIIDAVGLLSKEEWGKMGLGTLVFS